MPEVNQLVNEVQTTFAEIIQIGINCGIPFDHIPKSNGEVVYLQQTLVWVTFILGLAFKGLGKLMGASIGGVR